MVSRSRLIDTIIENASSDDDLTEQEQVATLDIPSCIPAIYDCVLSHNTSDYDK